MKLLSCAVAAFAGPTLVYMLLFRVVFFNATAHSVIYVVLMLFII